MRESEPEYGRYEDHGDQGAKELPAASPWLGGGHHRVSSLLALNGNVLGR